MSAENLERKVWRSVVYAFYKERPNVVRKNNRKGIRTTYLEFSCLKCSKPFLRGTGTDSGSTGVMRDHIPGCWGEDVWNEAKNLNLDPAKDVVKKFKTMKNVKLTKMFVRVSGSKESFSLAPASREEIWYASRCLPRDCNPHTTSVTTPYFLSSFPLHCYTTDTTPTFPCGPSSFTLLYGRVTVTRRLLLRTTLDRYIYNPQHDDVIRSLLTQQDA